MAAAAAPGLSLPAGGVALNPLSGEPEQAATNGEIVARGATPKFVAEDYDLPVEAVREALDYDDDNKEWIDAEVDEEARALLKENRAPIVKRSPAR